MLLDFEVFLEEVIVEVHVDRHVQQVNQDELPQWPHFLSRFHSLKHSHIDNRDEEQRYDSTSQTLLELTFLDSILRIKSEERHIFSKDQSLGNIVSLLFQSFIFKGPETVSGKCSFTKTCASCLLV